MQGWRRRSDGRGEGEGLDKSGGSGYSAPSVSGIGGGVAIDEAREDQARQLAAVQGLSLVRSRSRDRADDDYELYVLVRDVAEADSAFENGYGMTLMDVEKALNA
jgi:hypothetical protein